MVFSGTVRVQFFIGQSPLLGFQARETCSPFYGTAQGGIGLLIPSPWLNLPPPRIRRESLEGEPGTVTGFPRGGNPVTVPNFRSTLERTEGIPIGDPPDLFGV